MHYLKINICCLVLRTFVKTIYYGSLFSSQTMTDRIDLSRELIEGDVKQLYLLACSGDSNNPEYLDFFTTLVTVMKV